MSVYLVLLTHGCWGAALIESAQLVVGEISESAAIPLMEGESVEAYRTKIERLLENLGNNEAILVTDIQGGSPYFAAAGLGHKHGCPVVSGLSMELLLALCRARETGNAAETVRAALGEVRSRLGTVDEHLGRMNGQPQ